jgi:hypothetical protein
MKPQPPMSFVDEILDAAGLSVRGVHADTSAAAPIGYGA